MANFNLSRRWKRRLSERRENRLNISASNRVTTQEKPRLSRRYATVGKQICTRVRRRRRRRLNRGRVHAWSHPLENDSMPLWQAEEEGWEGGDPRSVSIKRSFHARNLFPWRHSDVGCFKRIAVFSNSTDSNRALILNCVRRRRRRRKKKKEDGEDAWVVSCFVPVTLVVDISNNWNRGQERAAGIELM